MFKNNSKIISFSLISLFIITLFNNVVHAAEECTLNGQVIPCEQLGKTITGFLGWGIIIFLIFFIIGILSMVFLIMMIIHVAKHDVENKAMWIVVMVFTGFIGAIVYYFVVKKDFDKKIIVSNQSPISNIASTPI